MCPDRWDDPGGHPYIRRPLRLRRGLDEIRPRRPRNILLRKWLVSYDLNFMVARENHGRHSRFLRQGDYLLRSKYPLVLARSRAPAKVATTETAHQEHDTPGGA